MVRMRSGHRGDSDRVDALLKELEGKDIAEVIAAGVSKLASVPAGGGGAAMASSGGAHCSALPPGHPAQGVEECIAACMRCPSTGLGKRYPEALQGNG